MGSGRYDPGVYHAFVSSTVGKSTEEVYTSRTLDPYLDPKGVKYRESRDSVDNPNSTPLIVALDVTGSMGILADNIARKGLGTLFSSILERKPITDPHLMFMGIGDANMDSAPLQVSQFEADRRIIDQLTKLYLEHGGGGNNFESYNFPWYFAAFHTVHDAMEKRGRRGYLFTVGDEQTPDPLTKDQIKRFIGDDIERELSPEDQLALAQRLYDCYHIIIEEGNYASSHLNATREGWKKMMGQHTISLANHNALAETIVSVIEIAEGRMATDSAAAWGGKTAEIVHEAVKSLPPGVGRPALGGPSTWTPPA